MKSIQVARESNAVKKYLGTIPGTKGNYLPKNNQEPYRQFLDSRYSSVLISGISKNRSMENVQFCKMYKMNKTQKFSLNA